MDIRVLGPLEIRVGSDVLALGGAKQRAVLATLLLRAGDVVSIERLVDELWGDGPPASAAHTLEVYISRLRQLLNGHGPSLVRRGLGYLLELGGVALDSRAFVELAEAASVAAAAGDQELVVEHSSSALALWRGPALADVALGASGRAEAERLEEMRLRTTERRMDAELALGRHQEIIGELQSSVAENPYRERFVHQLMLALYRSGRHAEALEVYEQTRRRLDEDLGLRPSADLQQLSGQIVRQEPVLQRAVPAPSETTRHPTRERARRLSSLVAVGAAVAAAMALSAAGAARQPEPAGASSGARLALVVQQGASASGASEWRRSELTNALGAFGPGEDVESELLTIRDEPSAVAVGRAAHRLATGDFDLILFALDADEARAFAPLVRRLSLRSVFLGSSLAEVGLAGVPAATGLRFATEQPAQLAGALSGLVAPLATPGRGRADMVSVVASEPTFETKQLIAGFRRGFERAQPRGKVRVDYTNETLDPTACERVANAQIDAGSDVLLVQSGPCGTGAVAVARTRGAWAISGDTVARPGHNVLGQIFKDWDNALYSVVGAFRTAALPRGRDVVLGLEGYNVGLEMLGSLAPGIGSKVVRLCSDIRLHSSGVTIPTLAEP